MRQRSLPAALPRNKRLRISPLCLAPSRSDMSVSYPSPTIQTQPRRYDVTVIGAGASGLVAAIQAARAGARCLLIEKTSMTGGTTTVGGVNTCGLFHAWGQQVIGGIGWELLTDVCRLTKTPLPDFSQWRSLPHWKLAVRVNIPLFAALADEKLQHSGVNLLLHTLLARADYDADNRQWELLLCGKEGLHPVTSRYLIDCTADANAVSLAGFPVRKSDSLQPGTLMFRVEGYCIDDLDLAQIEQAFEREVATGAMLRSDFYSMHTPVTQFLRNHGQNAIHVTDIDATTSEAKTRAEMKAREVMLRIFKFLRRQKGLEHLNLSAMSPECGIRETVTIEGETCISVADYTRGRLWEDSLCNSFFPIDLHRARGGVAGRSLTEGVVPTIPLRAQLPRNSRRLLVAGRIISSDREANSALRVQATAMATGQVAGATAALAAASDCELTEVPLPAIRTLLQKHQAILPQTPTPAVRH